VSAVLSLVCPACRAPLARTGGAWRCGGCGAAYPEAGGILHLVAGREGAPGYDPHYFESLPRVEDRHFWQLARREVILDGIRGSIPDWRQRPLFDIGCGTGGLLAWLASQGVPQAGACDAYVRALETARPRLSAPLLLVDEGRPPALGPGQRFLSLFDVLEHIDDDAATLAWLHSVLEPGGYLALTVPAHPFLFGETDRHAQHRRRYRRRELGQRLRQAGFEVRRLTHFMAPLVPLLWLTRQLSRRSPRLAGKDAELRVVPVVNGALRGVLKLERLALRATSLPFGSSLLAIARRPSAS
jgi:2-polyprenyl-3-methyl-5-hydroxy-6-metoxy-1,4-benzoquinol methylase